MAWNADFSTERYQKIHRHLGASKERRRSPWLPYRGPIAIAPVNQIGIRFAREEFKSALGREISTAGICFDAPVGFDSMFLIVRLSKGTDLLHILAKLIRYLEDNSDPNDPIRVACQFIRRMHHADDL